MLSKESNERLTRVGPGTPMGALLRRYWHPIAAAAELDVDPIKEVRVLGEDLVLYRDRRGVVGLVDRQCAHRQASLVDGTVDECGIRCGYHGWRYDEGGHCVEQPFEQTSNPKSTFLKKVRITAYPVVAKAGIVWAYLGPQPIPCLPDWDFFHQRGYKLVFRTIVPCNWLQCQENSIDPVHFEWLHDNWPARLGSAPAAPKHLKLRFDEFDFGFTYGRVREDSDESSPLWTVGRVCLWPNGFFTHSLSWRVPLDDEHTLLIVFHNFPMPGELAFEQARIPVVEDTLEDLAAIRRSLRGQHTAGPEVVNRFTLRQDVLAMAGQGRIADRSREHLGESDRGIIMMRARLQSDLDAIERGADPKAIIRDPGLNQRIVLPFVGGRASLTSPLNYFGAALLGPELTHEIENTWATIAAEHA